MKEINSKDPATITKPKSIQVVREQLIDRTLFYFLIFIVITGFVSLTRAFEQGWLPIMYFHVLLMMTFIIVFALRNRLSLKVKIFFIIGMVLVIAIGSMSAFGYSNGALVLLLTTCILSSIFLGNRSTIIFIITSTMIIVVFGYMVSSNILQFSLDFNKFLVSPTSWLTLLFAFVSLSIILHICISYVYEAMENSVEQAVSLYSRVNESNLELEEKISELKETEFELRESEERFRTLIDSSYDGMVIYALDENLTILEANNRALTSLKYTREEGIGKSLMMLVSEESREGFRIRLELLRKYPEKVFDSVELTVLQKDGTKIVVEIFGKGIIHDGQQARIIVFRDITDRKKAEEELRQSEERLSLVTTAANMGIFDWDVKNNVLVWDKSLYRLYGIKEDEFGSVYDAWLQAVHPDDQAYANEAIQKALRNEEEYDIEFRIFLPDKSIRVMLAKASVYFDSNGKPLRMTGFNIDITEQRLAEQKKNSMEEQLFHMAKMESVGRLAGGIAHDFNNILTSIMGYAEYLKIKFSDEKSDEGKAVIVINDSVERAATLTNQLLSFARKGKHEPVPINLNNVIDKVLRVSDKIFEQRVKVIEDFGEISNVLADKNQIDQVLTNLFINAKDAMPNGGKLTIKTEMTLIEDLLSINLPKMKKGNYVKISVTDTGVGMPKEVQDNIFEPFFTTKGDSQGTGLGLANSYNIIKNHNGYINVYSEVGIGTTFNVYFPVTSEEEVEILVEESIGKGEGTILVIDDEKEVREMVKLNLEGLGYSILTAIDGLDGLGKYKENFEGIDLVLIDMIMPRMSGKETFQALKEINPQIKALVVSGFSINGKVEETIKDGAIGFIQKPFRMQKLSEAITKAMNG